MSRYTETTGYILHCRDFKDSSLILEFFSKDFGKINLVAKGIKKNKKLKSQVRYFSLSKIQFFGKSQLKTLVVINIMESHPFEPLLEKATALYLNELLRYSLPEHEKAALLFTNYQMSLNKIGKSKLTQLLRNFEREILKHNGFELSIHSSLCLDDWLTINENQGLVVTNKTQEKLCLTADLEAFLKHQTLDFAAQKRLNKLMYNAINSSLMNRTLYARNFLKTLTEQHR